MQIVFVAAVHELNSNRDAVIGTPGGPGSGAATPIPTTVGKRKGKPGPKTNPGNVNAGLRALDRSRKPTRRWLKSIVPIHTVSGYEFLAQAWTTPSIFPYLLCFLCEAYVFGRAG